MIESAECDNLGYSDSQLESLSSPPARFESGVAPWINWESEYSSFGKAFRVWSKYPTILPLFVCSDHGVNWGSRCWPNEIGSQTRAFFTWNKKKAEMMRKLYGKRSYHVPHPWVYYRKKYFKSLPQSRFGTLVYYAHSNNTTTPVYDDLDEYINGLKSLPDKYHPITICLSFHDINKNVHKELRKYDIPLVTAGVTSSRKFVDRFYTLLYQHRYATSPNIGSHSFYVVEAGVPFFLYGEKPKLKFKGTHLVKDGRPDPSEYGDEQDALEFSRLEHSLSNMEDVVTIEQTSLVSKYLGLDSGITRFRGALILWRELFLNMDHVAIAYFKLGKSIAKKFFSVILSKEST